MRGDFDADSVTCRRRAVRRFSTTLVQRRRRSGPAALCSSDVNQAGGNYKLPHVRSRKHARRAARVVLPWALLDRPSKGGSGSRGGNDNSVMNDSPGDGGDSNVAERPVGRRLSGGGRARRNRDDGLPFLAVVSQVSRMVRRLVHMTSSRALDVLFQYGDTRDVHSLAHVLFLLSNIAFPVAGVSLICLAGRSQLLLGATILMAGVASHCFHASQVELGPNRRKVKIALGFDYLAALSVGLVVVREAIEVIYIEGFLPWSVTILAASAAAFYLVSSIRQRSLPYIVCHALWHIAAASMALALGLHHSSAIGSLPAVS